MGVLVLMVVLAGLRLARPHDDSAPLPAPLAPLRPIETTPAAPATSAPPTSSAPEALPPSRTLPAGTSSSTWREVTQNTPARTSSTPPPAPPVQGEYRVVDSYPDSFIGEVLVRNTTAGPADWVVELRFPAGVGGLRASWVEAAQQATLSQDGGSYLWRSGQPVDAGASALLRFHFDRQGSGDQPSSCTVDGTPCA
ncbi:cellulose binding domain-containing protein [Micromonosporaceae bacterium Da 78-11]